jgi:hypothetical protein
MFLLKNVCILGEDYTNQYNNGPNKYSCIFSVLLLQSLVLILTQLSVLGYKHIYLNQFVLGLYYLPSTRSSIN